LGLEDQEVRAVVPNPLDQETFGAAGESTDEVEPQCSPTVDDVLRAGRVDSDEFEVIHCLEEASIVAYTFGAWLPPQIEEVVADEDGCLQIERSIVDQRTVQPDLSGIAVSAVPWEGQPAEASRLADCAPRGVTWGVLNDSDSASAQGPAC